MSNKVVADRQSSINNNIALLFLEHSFLQLPRRTELYQVSLAGAEATAMKYLPARAPKTTRRQVPPPPPSVMLLWMSPSASVKPCWNG